MTFPCDDFIAQPDAALYRGVTINASPKTVFRWLCQLRVAPYSYDWIDNGGQQSPQGLTPGMEDLAVGQEVMRIFNLTAFAQDRQLTLQLKPKSGAAKTFGDVGVSYLIIPLNSQATTCCRLLVKLVAKYPSGLYGRMMRALLPWGDLIMMRRQLLNLKRLAEGMANE
ncbi:MAG TPA: hypothetical protein VK208_11045 [Pyrinomonadaceae bacterium]|jgi:hypothetical protein|nr:hypothetical protein [Pyrinomonadaceae bacterium]